MVNVYGDRTLLTEKMDKLADEITLYLSNRNDVSCYFKYPLLKENSTSNTLSFLIISQSGIFNICESINEKKAFDIYYLPKLLSIDSVYQKQEKGMSVYKNIDISNGFFFDIFDNENILTKEEIETFEAMFQSAESINVKTDRTIKNDNSLGSLIVNRAKQINRFSSPQFDYVNNASKNGFYRIRGLAGSGKTIIMAKRMALMHYKYPDLKIAFVFYTVSLKQTIIKLFNEFYIEYSNGLEPNSEQVFFLHGWGSSSTPGFYSSFCKANNISTEPYEWDNYQRNSFGLVCERALDSSGHKMVSMFDYVFIDEAQDFPLEFFKMVLCSLSPGGAFSYAYDELQNLSYSQQMPSKSEIFSDDITVNDVNLRICYRTPKEILVTAHAFGIGIYRDNAENTLPINIPAEKSIWQAIGYNAKPAGYKYGDIVTFYRDEPFAKKIVPEEPVVIKQFETLEKQYIELYSEINNLIKNEDVLTDDILIIDLESGHYDSNFFEFRRICNIRQNKGKSVDETRRFETHLVNANDRFFFRRSNSIPYTSVFRAKGNESNIVFVINCQNMESLQSYSRNRLFTSMTRAKFKVYVYGTTGVDKFIHEYERVKEKGYILFFKYPTKAELEKIQKIAREDEYNAGEISKVGEVSDKLKNKEDESAYREMLIRMHGKEIAEAIIRMEKDGKKA